MSDLDSILRLYVNVSDNDIEEYGITRENFRRGINIMARAYAPNSANFESASRPLPDYNNGAYRTAYLHKYAPLHTYIVLDVMKDILDVKPDLFDDALDNFQHFEFCSLGGGPGCDIIGALAVLLNVYGRFSVSATIIDCMEEWKDSCSSLISELSSGFYGEIWRDVTYDWPLYIHFIGCNLLDATTDEVHKTIASATFLTMIKFVSAANSTGTEQMIDKIFRALKPGALVLYIDSAAGGFSKMVKRASKRNRLVPVYGPKNHVRYKIEALKTKKFGRSSCIETKVTIILWKKKLHHARIKRDPASSKLKYENILSKILQNDLRILLHNNRPKQIKMNLNDCHHSRCQTNKLSLNTRLKRKEKKRKCIGRVATLSKTSENNHRLGSDNNTLKKNNTNVNVSNPLGFQADGLYHNTHLRPMKPNQHNRTVPAYSELEKRNTLSKSSKNNHRLWSNNNTLKKNNTNVNVFNPPGFQANGLYFNTHLRSIILDQHNRTIAVSSELEKRNTLSKTSKNNHRLWSDTNSLNKNNTNVNVSNLPGYQAKGLYFNTHLRPIISDQHNTTVPASSELTRWNFSCDIPQNNFRFSRPYNNASNYFTTSVSDFNSIYPINQPSFNVNSSKSYPNSVVGQSQVNDQNNRQLRKYCEIALYGFGRCLLSEYSPFINRLSSSEDGLKPFHVHLIQTIAKKFLIRLLFDVLSNELLPSSESVAVSDNAPCILDACPFSGILLFEAELSSN